MAKKTFFSPKAPVELRPGDIVDLGHWRLTALAKDTAPVEVVPDVQQVVWVVGLETCRYLLARS